MMSTFTLKEERSVTTLGRVNNLESRENDEFSVSSSLPILHDYDKTLLRNKLGKMVLGKSYRCYLPHERLKMEQYESVDTYELPTTIYKDHLESRSQEPRWFIWVFVFGLGIASSMIAITMISVLHMLNSVRYELLGFGLRGFSFKDPNRYPQNASTQRSDLDVAAMFEGASVGLYGIEPRSLTKGYLMWVSFSLVMSTISSLLCLLVPESVCSGLPEVIAYLNGVHYPILSNFWVFMAKIGFIIFSVASGACTGHFSTLILAGAMLGAQVLQRRRYFRCDSVNIIECFRNPRDRRIIIVIGAAAGVASAFGVSIGGLMVVVELISTILPVRFALYVFVASLVSSLTLQIYFSFFLFFSPRDRNIYPQGQLISELTQSFVSYVSFDDLVRMNIMYFIPTTIIGILCGVFAIAFIRLSQVALLLRHYLQRRLKTRAVNYVLPVLFTVVYVSINYWIAAAFGSEGWPSPPLSPSHINESLQSSWLKQQQHIGNGSQNLNIDSVTNGPCVGIPSTIRNARNLSVIGYYGANGFFCAKPNGMYKHGNEEIEHEEQTLSVLHSYASLAFANADSTIQTLFTWRTEEVLGVTELITFLVIYFLGSAFFLGFSLGGDTILPGLVIGALIGRLTGICVFRTAVYLQGKDVAATWADSGCFALIGAGSFLGGTTGLTFSICTILMECTGDFQHILPLMMGITIAKKTAELFTKSINAILLEMESVPMLDFENEVHKYPMFDARHVMTRQVVTLRTVCTIGHILEVLRCTHHNAFPIESVRDQTYKGIIMRQQLEILLWHVHFTEYPSTYTYDVGKKMEARLFYDHLLGVLPPLETRLEIRIDLSPYIDHSGFCVLETTTLPRTYTMFRTLGLRHLTVVNANNIIVGIITRKDLVTDRILETIIAADEARRAFVEARRQEAEDILNPTMGNNRGAGGSASYLVNTAGDGSLWDPQKIRADYEFYCLGEWIVMRRYESGLSEDVELRGIRMHPNIVQVNALRAQDIGRSTLQNMDIYTCKGYRKDCLYADEENTVTLDDAPRCPLKTQLNFMKSDAIERESVGVGEFAFPPVLSDMISGTSSVREFAHWHNGLMVRSVGSLASSVNPRQEKRSRSC